VKVKAVLAIIWVYLMAWPAGYVFCKCLHSSFDNAWVTVASLMGIFSSSAVAFTVLILWILGLPGVITRVIAWISGDD